MTENRMAFQADVQRLLDIVVHSLYSQKEIFLRELISNASDACDKLRYIAITNPELLPDDVELGISLAVDKAARTLTISDNGIGMGCDELAKNLGTLARSGTREFLDSIDPKKRVDVNQIGQFGVGFYAVFMVAQMVEVRSKRAGEGEAWCWRSDGGGEFSIEEDNRPNRGTDIVIYLKQGEDEFLDEERLQTIVRRYSDHIALPIRLDGKEEPLNRANALWLRAKSSVSVDEYREFYHHVAHAFDEPALTAHWKAEGKIEYSALLFIPGTKPWDLMDPKRRHSVRLYVRRVFITDDAEGLVPAWLRFLRGVVDSEDLPLNVSREMLQSNPVLSKIRLGITRRVISDLNRFAADDKAGYAKFWGNFGAVLKEGLYEDVEHKDSLLDALRFRTTISGEELISLNDYSARMKDGQKIIWYLVGDDAKTLERSPHLEGFRARGIEVVLLTDQVDDFWPATVEKWQDKELRSITRASAADLDAVPPKEDSNKPKEDSQAAPEADMAALQARMKRVLGDNISEVRASTRLVESAVCLVSGDNDMDLHLEKFLRQHNQAPMQSRRIIELNPKHALIRALAVRAVAAGDGNDGVLDDSLRLLYDEARLQNGEPPSDAMSFGARLNDMLLKNMAAA